MYLKIRIACGECGMTLAAINASIQGVTVSDRQLAQNLETITHRCDGRASLIPPKKED